MKTIICAVALALAATGALAQKTVLRFSTAAPPPDFLSKSLQQFKSELEKAAPEFDVQVYPGSQLFRQGTEVPALQRGNLEMSTMTTFEVAQQVPELGFFNRAYLFRDYEHAYKTFTGPVGKRYADTVAQKM
ncbi:MAG TPA: C4-dicarboxylate ABC transporter, partial [Burkholderiales bacterium]